jgi:DNA-3-methyladenine glycosylase
MRKLPRSFYLGSDVVAIAQDLLGKVLVTRFDGLVTAGIISETEAYAGARDRASHAYAGRRTRRNEVMYARGGMAYVYLCYGIHHLFNVVTNSAEIPHAVLIRAMHPLDGIETMRERRGNGARLSTGGPGTLTQALGIRTAHSGTDLLGDTIYIEDRAVAIPSNSIITGPRIGVDYAGADALLPYRFHFDPRLLS